MNTQLFIKSWPALWLWMQYLNRELSGSEISQTYTFRKGRLDMQLLRGEKPFLLSWEKKGHQVLITTSNSSSLPKRRVEVLRKLPAHSVIQNIQVHSKDKLLKMQLTDGTEIIFGAFPGAINVYYLSHGKLVDTFLKKDDFPAITDQWLDQEDTLPATIPGGHVSSAQLRDAQRTGLTVDWKQNKIIFGSPENEAGLNISDCVLEVLRHTQKPKRSSTTSLRKTAKTLLKRWKSKFAKIEVELQEARNWPELQQRLEFLKIGMGMGLEPDRGELHIPAELSQNGVAVSIQIEEGSSVQDAIKSTAKKIRKFQAKLDSLERMLPEIEADIHSLEALLTEGEDKILLIFLQDHGELLDKAGKPQEQRKAFKKYVSPSGFDILVGRSSRDNDTLTFKIASKNDWWFHARKVRGSHVILRTGNQVPQQADLRAAAEHAALNSKSKHSGVVVVQYCQRKHLSKPKASHPGTVLVHQENSITIGLD